MFKNEQYSSFLNIFTKNLIYNLISAVELQSLEGRGALFSD